MPRKNSTNLAMAAGETSTLGPPLETKRYGPMETLLTKEEVCGILQISQSTFYRLARSGRLPAARIGAEWRVKPSVLARFIDRHTVRPYPRRKGHANGD